MHMADWPVSYRHDVDWVVGAAMLSRREALEQLRLPEGPFDERFMYSGNSISVCASSRRAGVSFTCRKRW